jgi:trans-aconitate methyltransferase
MSHARQSWDPQQYAENARFVSDLGAPVLELLDPRAGERILDVGCGDGALTKRLVDAGAKVIGIDASEAMVAAAQARGLDARVMDGHALSFDQEFDAVFSNAALHWLKRPDTVIAGVHAALVPGGRFIAECGGYGNTATVTNAIGAALAARGIDAANHNPWYFPTIEDYSSRLERGGFVVRSIALIPRPTPLPGHLVAWLETFAQSFTAALPENERSVVLAEVAERCRATLCDAAGRWSVDYVRLRFAADKPATPRSTR